MGLLVVGIPVNFLLVKISWHGMELNLLLLQWFGTICLLLWSGNANQNIFFGLSISLNLQTNPVDGRMAELWFNTFFEVNLEYDVQQTLMRH
jgi:hypothetical protein